LSARRRTRKAKRSRRYWAILWAVYFAVSIALSVLNGVVGINMGPIRYALLGLGILAGWRLAEWVAQRLCPTAHES
jgi:hypothetical protein